ncbi:PTS glucose transporter subunit IIA [Enterococcus casseliflavus]|uniref:PTS sugar transporter subunit IIA n=1 Tax=Enterococcus casseliflavus TaxID=37734 RepID=UPI0039A50694
MFDFFKKKPAHHDNGVYAPATGVFVAISEVPDEVFSQKMMGDGFAILPNEGTIYSPISGTVESIFPTKHAIGIKTDSGQDVIVHMGIETVDLEGTPFDVYVKVGSKVDSKTKLAKMDLVEIEKAQRDSHVIVVFPELNDKKLEISSTKEVINGDKVGALL